MDYQFSRSAKNTTFFSKFGGFVDTNAARATWIFDTVEMREIEEAYKGLSNEHVYVPPNLRSFYPEDHPFTSARIAPDEGVQSHDVRQLSGYAVFEDRAAVVFETRETLNGRECVVVGFLDWAILLDPSLNYAIVEERFGDLEFRGRYVSNEPHHKRQNSDFVQLGDGPFLPRRSVLEQRRDGRIYRKVEAVIDSLEVQPEQSYVETFKRPEHLYVTNSITGKSSLAPGARSNGTLHRQPSSGRVWVMVGGNAIVLLVISYVWCRVRRRKVEAARE